MRPLELADAAFILKLRLDPNLNRFIHRTSARLADQETWLRRYLGRGGDWYFVVVDKRTGEREGTIGIYDHEEHANVAEWGRWIIRPGSLASIESAILIYRVAFERLGLNALYCRTVAENAAVVSFHDSSGAPRRAHLKAHVEFDGRKLDSVEHFVDQLTWERMKPRLQMIADRLAA